MNRPGPILLAVVVALSLGAMGISLPLLGQEWLVALYWYWWIPALGLGALCMLIWQAFAVDPLAFDREMRPAWRWWLLALVPVFLLPIVFLVYFNMMCGDQQHCI